MLLIALIITMFRHAVLGLQVVIEDYVHTRWLEVASLVVIKFIAGTRHAHGRTGCVARRARKLIDGILQGSTTQA